ncbi:hypothetical protein [Snodgrassella communis]|uniref:hypothetical protein n=1 Tax=Snodgrassella communis TaxID=2946699 RepID=UPI001EF45370|nr:hypothetical protein [Snodgrassella communis]
MKNKYMKKFKVSYNLLNDRGSKLRHVIVEEEDAIAAQREAFTAIISKHPNQGKPQIYEAYEISDKN